MHYLALFKTDSLAGMKACWGSYRDEGCDMTCRCMRTGWNCMRRCPSLSKAMTTTPVRSSVNCDHCPAGQSAVAKAGYPCDFDITTRLPQYR